MTQTPLNYFNFTSEDTGITQQVGLKERTINSTEMTSLTNSQKVKEFTEGMLGHPIPKYPQALSREKVKFICRMVISELNELMATVITHEDELVPEMQWCLNHSDPHAFQANLSNEEVITEQADAMVDAMYYMYDTAARHGMNLDKYFEVVHDANMDKRDPVTKQFIRREDGKVMKRDGWNPPDVGVVTRDQLKNGGF